MMRKVFRNVKVSGLGTEKLTDCTKVTLTRRWILKECDTDGIMFFPRGYVVALVDTADEKGFVRFSGVGGNGKKIDIYDTEENLLYAVDAFGNVTYTKSLLWKTRNRIIRFFRGEK